ncbi:MAG: type II toxin-antitoxin system RelE/ParE family toxin [Burkholderiaceae bacterium]
MFKVRYTEEARQDLVRLFDFLLERAETVKDFDAAQVAVNTITSEVDRHLARSPFIYRKVGDNPFLRELIISFGNSGYVALYEIEDAATITILAVRHQREDDYH